MRVNLIKSPSNSSWPDLQNRSRSSSTRTAQAWLSPTLIAVTTPRSAGGTASTLAGFAITQAQAGQYRWIAVYSGDQFNNSFTTACGAETHTITVQSPQ